VARALVIGYGNPLRSDDGVGWIAARRLSEQLPATDIEVLYRHELTPELAEAISAAQLVVFLDASAKHLPGEVKCQELWPSPSHPAFSHQLSATQLLELASDLYGAVPRAYLFSVGGASFEVGNTLSPEVAQALPGLLEHVSKIVR
jgi:hydrogenase maturation protease